VELQQVPLTQQPRGQSKCITQDIVIYLEGESIFEGMIRKAPGTLFDLKSCCEVILFTSSQETLQKIAEKDWVAEVLDTQLLA